MIQLRSKKYSYLGVFLALALLLSYVESLLPVFFAVPGMKLGLTNVVIVLTLYFFGVKEAFLISISRILLVAILFGNAYSFLYSLCGGMLSLLFMSILYKMDRYHMMTISIVGGITHNFGQILAAMILLDNSYIFSYYPILFISGALTGFLIGFLSFEIYKRIYRLKIKEE